MHSLQKQAVGGPPPRYVPAQACNGSVQQQSWARPAEPGQYASSIWPAVHDRRQTASSLNPPWAVA